MKRGRGGQKAGSMYSWGLAGRKLVDNVVLQVKNHWRLQLHCRSTCPYCYRRNPTATDLPNAPPPNPHPHTCPTPHLSHSCMARPLQAGDAVVFPAKKVWHRVTKTRSGLRRTVVFWVSAPAVKGTGPAAGPGSSEEEEEDEGQLCLRWSWWRDRGWLWGA